MGGSDFSLNVWLHRTSMVVLKVYIRRVTGSKAKGNPPVLVYFHSPISRTIALQLMQTEMRQCNIFETARRVDDVKSIA